MIRWGKQALSEGAHKFVVHSVQGILTFVAISVLSSFAIYFIDPWSKIAAHWPKRELTEKEMVEKAVHQKLSPIVTGDPQQLPTSDQPLPENKHPSVGTKAQSWTTDVFVEPER